MVKNMKIISWNINGFESLIRDKYFDEILDQEPDILCLQEVKCKKELPAIEGYNIYNYPSTKAGSGVAVYSKIKAKKTKKGIRSVKFDIEGRVLTLTFPDFDLITVYSPSGAGNERLCDKYEFYDRFTNFLRKSEKPLIICGDFNRISQDIDAKNPDEMRKKPGFLPQEEMWFKGILNSGYIDAFRYFHEDNEKFTWWPYSRNARELNNGLRLDYFLVDKQLEDLLKDSVILENQYGSDHAPIVLELDLTNK